MISKNQRCKMVALLKSLKIKQHFKSLVFAYHVWLLVIFIFIQVISPQ